MEQMSYSSLVSSAMGLLCLIVVTECVQGFNTGGQGCSGGLCENSGCNKVWM